MKGLERAATVAAQLRATALAAALVLPVAAACSPAPTLRMVGDSTASVAISNTPYGDPRSVGSIMLCLTSPGTATITGVALHEPSGEIRVDAFAVRPNPFTQGQDGLGTDDRSLASFAADFDPGGTQRVSGVCPADAQASDAVQASDTPIDAQASELGVQVSLAAGETGGGRGLDVTYDLGGTKRTAVIPFGVWLCARTCPDGPGS
jgi:hypothetical protein